MLARAREDICGVTSSCYLSWHIPFMPWMPGPPHSGGRFLVMAPVEATAQKAGGTDGRSSRMNEAVEMGRTSPSHLGAAQKVALGLVGILLVIIAWGCTRGTILKLDGSSTVFPVSEAMAEEFQKQHREFRVTVGISGTGGGFRKFCNGEIDIAGASRPIKPVEVDACARSGISYIEIPVAYDGLTVIVNQDNDWVDFLTVEELREMWKPGSTIKKWSDIRPGWPARDLVLVGADTDSGTFDYFTKAIVGEEGASRPDYTASADDNVLVQAVAREKRALGYLGFAYFAENATKLTAVPVDPGTGWVTPTSETIMDGSYSPLSRPLLIYVNSRAAQRPEVQDFVRFYLDSENEALIREVGYVPFPERLYSIVQKRFEDRVTGSVFGGKGSQVGLSIEDLLGRE